MTEALAHPDRGICAVALAPCSSTFDCEGDLIERVRPIVGLKVPIGVELDLHCHFTERIRTQADVIGACQGLDLAARRAIVVKPPQQFHAAFAPLASEVI